MFARTTLLLMLAVAAVTGLVPAALAQRGNPDMRWRGESIDAMIAVFMAENDVPGLSLAIVQAPYIPRAVGYGLADTQTRTLVATNTVFDVGQMAHAYAGVAAMQLVEKGTLGLDDPVGKYLPALADLPEIWRAVPVRALLAHASGLPDDGDPARPLAFAPGSNVAPSATDTRLLMRVVETASGQSYRDFVRANQFERLGLTHTFFAEEAAVRMHSEDVAESNNRHKGFLADPRLINPTERATGSGGEPSARPAPDAILASAMDISLWDVGLAGGILVKDPALRAILYAPFRLPDGSAPPVMGAWRFPGRKGLMYVTGNGNGQSAFLSRFTDPSELVCVTLLANREGLDFTQLARRIAGAYDPRLGPPAAPGMRVQQSPWPVGETLSRFEAALSSQGFTVRSRADVSSGKNRAGQENMRFVFTVADAPKGSRPLQAVAWEEDGQIWLGCTDPAATGLAGKAGQDAQRLTLRRALDRLLLLAVTPY